MSKIIIQNDSSLPDTDAVERVLSVMKLGRISAYGKQYCYSSLFDTVVVYSLLNKKSDRFVIEDR